VETAKKPGRYGRSCRVCKLYFITSDPNTYTCPWCNKGETSPSIMDYEAEGISMQTQMLVQEEVQ